jgi:hypothetical protein
MNYYGISMHGPFILETSNSFPITNPGTGRIVKYMGSLFIYNGSKWVRFVNKNSSIGSQLFSSSGTFTVPDGVIDIGVYVIGGGGGGGGSIWILPDTLVTQGYGGGSGGYAYKSFKVTPREEISVTVGTGGSAGIHGDDYEPETYGGSGLTSSFLTLSASGGMGGRAGMNGGGGSPNGNAGNLVSGGASPSLSLSPAGKGGDCAGTGWDGVAGNNGCVYIVWSY